MYPSLNPLKEKIHLFSPLCAKRILRSNYLYLSRYVSNTRDGEPCDAKAQPQHVSLLQPENSRRDKSINSKPIRLGICRLASGKLQVITSASTLGDQERGSRSWSWSKSYLQKRENSLMLASVSKPSSLVVLDDAGHCSVDKDVSPYTENNHNREEQSNADHEELPLLFLHENNNYEEALKTIGAAGESGSLCQSAAAQLKDLCHHLHVEDAIWAAAKPCKDRVDDIIIRKDYSAGESYKHDYSFFFQSTDTGIQSLSEKETGKKLNPCTANLPERVEPSMKHPYTLPPDKLIPHDAGSFSTASDIPVVGSASYEDMLSVLQCVGESEKKTDDPAPSDGPSKEQLSYMHHRLSEEMPKFFEQSHDYGLYADTVHFDNRIMKVSTRGLAAYKATVQSLKYLSTAYLTSSQMELLRITMETEQHCIQARWRIKGVPLHSYLLRPWGKKHKYRYFDAFSTFYVGSDGLIHSHVLDKVMPSSEGKVVAASWAVRLGIMMGVVRPPAYEPDIMKAITLMKALLGK
ncbi:uncharacterized protein LOC129277839 [Lytechinus pictus]|uniref:uncharacterized protein LOC129277839 n=1 Tax=Lytechinus pictus TaxID=7653 RepID=UPI0030BA0E79